MLEGGGRGLEEGAVVLEEVVAAVVSEGGGAAEGLPGDVDVPVLTQAAPETGPLGIHDATTLLRPHS